MDITASTLKSNPSARCNSERIERIIQYAHRTAQLLNARCNSERIERLLALVLPLDAVVVDATQKELKAQNPSSQNQDNGTNDATKKELKVRKVI
jgi:hypothetical protein